jgi:hypothetical protein
MAPAHRQITVMSFIKAFGSRTVSHDVERHFDGLDVASLDLAWIIHTSCTTDWKSVVRGVNSCFRATPVDKRYSAEIKVTHESCELGDFTIVEPNVRGLYDSRHFLIFKLVASTVPILLARDEFIQIEQNAGDGGPGGFGGVFVVWIGGKRRALCIQELAEPVKFESCR